MSRRTPQIYSGAGQSIHSSPVDLPIPSSLTSAALAFGSLLKPGTGGWQAAASNDDTVSHILINLYKAAGSPQRNQVSADATALAAENFVAQAYPLVSQGQQIEIGLDGTVADIVATPYFDIVVSAPSVISADNNPTAGAVATVQLSAASANASASGRCFQVLGYSPSSDTAIATGNKNVIAVKI